jgi:hypothetical protein
MKWKDLRGLFELVAKMLFDYAFLIVGKNDPDLASLPAFTTKYTRAPGSIRATTSARKDLLGVVIE